MESLLKILPKQTKPGHGRGYTRLLPDNNTGNTCNYSGQADVLNATLKVAFCLETSERMGHVDAALKLGKD